MKDITLGQYFPGESIIHRSDPRTKILLTIAFMLLVFTATSYAAFAVAWIFVLLCIYASGIPFSYAFKGLKPILFIIIFTSFINLFFTPGKTLVEWNFINITYEGVDTAAKVILRLSILIVGASLLTLTTTPLMLTDGLEKLAAPLKKLHVPVHEIAMMMVIALKFIPILLEETDKIMKAQASRGADFETGNILKRAKSFVPVLVPLFVSAFRRADELALAMESRCYRGGEGRTRMRILKFGRVDIYALVYFIGFVFAGYLVNSIGILLLIRNQI